MVYASVWLGLAVLVASSTAYNYPITSTEWINYKRNFGKTYANSAAENNAVYYYNYNMNLIAKHNAYYDLGTYTYWLRANQFADGPLTSAALQAKFPVATPLSTSSSSLAPPASPTTPVSFDPRIDPGIPITVQDQGTACNSGWAYAAAAATQLRKSLQTLSPAATLSAQNLIDCAGGTRGCSNQVAQAAFDYLVTGTARLHTVTEYPNDKLASTQGACRAPAASTTATTVSQYARLTDGADNNLQQFVGNWYPTVVEFNPNSYQFILYGGGIFQPPATGAGSHFMTVVGYEATNWLVQNSFGVDWGELGLIRIARTASKPLTKSAVFPSMLV